MILLTGSLFMLQACSKSSQEEMVLAGPSVSDEVISATVLEGATYELLLAEYGTVTISNQADNYLESTAGIDPKTGLMTYKYVPAVGFTGTDEVVLKSAKMVRSYSSGNSCNDIAGGGYDRTVSSYITIKLQVTR
jgi:hypothetical protein